MRIRSVQLTKNHNQIGYVWYIQRAVASYPVERSSEVTLWRHRAAVRFLPINFDINELKTWSWCHSVRRARDIRPSADDTMTLPLPPPVAHCSVFSSADEDRILVLVVRRGRAGRGKGLGGNGRAIFEPGERSVLTSRSHRTLRVGVPFDFFHFRLSAIWPLSHWLFAVLTFCFWLFPFDLLSFDLYPFDVLQFWLCPFDFVMESAKTYAGYCFAVNIYYSLSAG